MTAVTLLNIIGYILLGTSWIIDWTTDPKSEKALTTKIIVTGIGIGVFLSAMVVNIHQYLSK
jgi:hypothetical protein